MSVIRLAGARRIDVQWVGKAGTFGLMFAFPLFLASHAKHLGWQPVHVHGGHGVALVDGLASPRQRETRPHLVRAPGQHGELAAQLFRRVVSMKESATYQAILQEGLAEGEARGAVREARKLLRKFGDRAFGPPNEAG